MLLKGKTDENDAIFSPPKVTKVSAGSMVAMLVTFQVGNPFPGEISEFPSR